ncbi:hypothetical protein HU200_013996 [Digitaria exilis]|uniref:Uncharacterized protein n=1 Tax=Digitaria exilis TaxID=1010633 RepID=A0A835FCM3_9POAL|nr:hypothetical protein HU200_013996 [Digitaria exilis]
MLTPGRDLVRPWTSVQPSLIFISSSLRPAAARVRACSACKGLERAALAGAGEPADGQTRVQALGTACSANAEECGVRGRHGSKQECCRHWHGRYLSIEVPNKHARPPGRYPRPCPPWPRLTAPPPAGAAPSLADTGFLARFISLHGAPSASPSSTDQWRQPPEMTTTTFVLVSAAVIDVAHFSLDFLYAPPVNEGDPEQGDHRQPWEPPPPEQQAVLGMEVLIAGVHCLRHGFLGGFLLDGNGGGHCDGAMSNLRDGSSGTPRTSAFIPGRDAAGSGGPAPQATQALALLGQHLAAGMIYWGIETGAVLVLDESTLIIVTSGDSDTFVVLTRTEKRWLFTVDLQTMVVERRHERNRHVGPAYPCTLPWPPALRAGLHHDDTVGKRRQRRDS